MPEKKRSAPGIYQHLSNRVLFVRPFYCRALFALVFLMASFLAPHQATAQEKTSLSIELNSLAKTSNDGCRMNFILHNGLPSAIDSLAFEIVLFDKQERVNDLLRLNIGALSKGKTRVRQFDLKSTKCSDISRVLVNEITVCKGEGLTPRICLQALKTKKRTAIEFGQ